MSIEKIIPATSAETTTAVLPVAIPADPHRRRYVLPTIVAIVAVVLVAAAAGVWLLWGGDRDSRITGGGNALAKELGLPKSHACGDQTETFQLTKDDESERVFALTTTWFHVRKCLVNLMAVAEKEPESAPIHAFIERQVLYAMSQRPVRFYRLGESERLRFKKIVADDGSIDALRFDRVVYTNKHGIAHNSMSQAEMGIWLLGAKRRLAERGILPETAARYEQLGIAAIRVVLDAVADGGLRSGGPCDLRPELPCAWYHAVTNPTRRASDEGGTLNKNLLVITHLEAAALELARIEAVEPGASRNDAVEEFHAAADAGIYQLVYSSGHTAAGSPPNLFDYVARDAAGKPIARSWLYYGLNPEKARVGYFLQRNNYKNCHYHLFDTRLLRDIFAGPGRDADLSGFTQPRDEFGKSLVAFIVDAYEMKAAENLFVDSPTTEGGNYAGCKKELVPSWFAEVVSYLKAMSPPDP